MKLTKVHQVLMFQESQWLNPYIDLKSEKKKESHSFEKDFFKSMNSDIYSKAMGNLRNRVDASLVTNTKDSKINF